MKNKIIIFLISLLTLFLVFLIVNNMNIKNKSSFEFINETIKVKEALLKENNNITKSIEGNLFIRGSEKLLKNIELILLKENGKNYEKISIAYTDENGNYKFTNLENGNYKIKLETNEDYKILNEDEVITVTDEMLVKNINIEVLETDEFKAQISKYIKQVKLIEGSRESIYNYDNQNKVLIPLKNVKKLGGTIEYEFLVTNVKSKEGFVKVIKDKLPEGLSFNKGKNPLWKEKNGYLYTTQLSNVVLNENETKKISLILDINNTDEAKTYLNKVSITGEVYHKVTFINLGDIFSELNILDGDTIAEEIKPILLGFRFTGWYKDEENKELFDFSQPITEDTKIYAGWEKEINVKYMIDNNLYKEEIIYEGEKTKKPLNPSIEGYVFDNWYSDLEYTKLFDFNQSLYEDIIIYGKLDKKIVNYDVTYMIDENEYSKQTLLSGSQVENKIAPIKKNKELDTRVASYQFDGWYEDENYTKKYDFNRGIDKNLILYGKYKETLSCKTINNVKIPTKEEIINNISYQINKVDLDESNANISVNDGNGEHVIIDGFEATYYDNTKTSYRIIGYTNDTIPDNLIIPDTILSKPVVSLVNVFQNKTINNVKISSTLETMAGVFNNSIINGDIDFNEAVKLKTIEGSFNYSEFKNIDLGNSISLTTILYSFVNSTGENVFFDNTINLVRISALFSNSTLNSVDFGNSINLTSFNSGSVQWLTVNNLFFSNMLSLNEIKAGSFSGTKINNLDFGNLINLTNIESEAFTDLSIEELNMSKLFSLTSINDNVFNSNNYNSKNMSINKISLSSYLKNIGKFSFYKVKMKDIDMECAKNSLESINSSAFAENNIKQVNIIDFPKLNSIDLSAFGENPLKLLKFQNLPSLEKINYTTSELTFDDQNNGIIFDNIGITNMDFSSHLSTTGMKQIIIQNNPNLEFLVKILYDESSMDKIIIQNNPKLTDIKNDAFHNSAAKKLIMKDLPSLKNIERYAFHGSNGLLDITLEDLPSLEYIGERAFSSYASPLNIYYPDHNITLKNLPNLKIIDEEAFMRLNIKEINLINLPSLTNIKFGAFSFNNTENLILTGDNLPNLTTIGKDAFVNWGNSRKNLIVKDLPKLSGTLMYGIGSSAKGYNDYTYYDNVIFENLPFIDKLADGNFYNYVKNLTIKNCERLDLSYTTFDSSISSSGDVNDNINSLKLENLPSTFKLTDREFFGQNISELDLSKMENLQEIGEYTFAYNTLTTIKLPETLITIGNYAFSMGNDIMSASNVNNNIKCVEIKGDNTRFNNIWNQIGFPSTIMPSSCAFTNNTVNILNNLSANIANTKSKTIDLKVFNIVLFKMDNKRLIDNTKTYRLQKLINRDFIDINVLEDIENVGRYSLDDNSDDKIKPFNNKIYLSNITQGTYKLVDENNEDNTLTFIVESNGEITGNAKISLLSNNDKIMSSSEAELIITIKTGNDVKNYFILSFVLFILVIFTFNKKKLLK